MMFRRSDCWKVPAKKRRSLLHGWSVVRSHLCGKEHRRGGQAGLQVVQRRLAQRQGAAGEVEHIIHDLRQSAVCQIAI